MTSISASLISANRRMEILKGMPSKQVQVICTGDILDTLFFSDDDMPFSNPQTAIESALSEEASVHRARIEKYVPDGPSNQNAKN